MSILTRSGFAGVFVGLVVYAPEFEDRSGAILGGVAAFVAIAIGLAAVQRTRPLAERTWAERARIAGIAIALGMGVGLYNLLANYAISLLDTAIHAEMAGRFYSYSAWSMLVRDPLMEEIVFRLLLIGGLAWLIGRITDDRRRTFRVALGVSAVLFGLLHITALALPAGATGVAYAAAVAIKAGIAALVLGWVFWRWGLAYSYTCHAVANATHLLLMPLLF